MVWELEIEELKGSGSCGGEGGRGGIAEQRRGKLTVREHRPAYGCGFLPGELAGAATYDGNTLAHVRPSNMVVGLGELDRGKALPRFHRQVDQRRPFQLRQLTKHGIVLGMQRHRRS